MGRLGKKIPRYERFSIELPNVNELVSIMTTCINNECFDDAKKLYDQWEEFLKDLDRWKPITDEIKTFKNDKIEEVIPLVRALHVKYAELKKMEANKALNIMIDHFENERFDKAWEIHECWVKHLKELRRWKPVTNRVQSFKDSKTEEFESLVSSLTVKYADLDNDMDWIEYRKRKDLFDMKILKETKVTHSNPYTFLDYVETHIHKYGKDLKDISKSVMNDRKLIINAMDSMIYEMHLFFNVWNYNDLFTIDDENIRLKIAELARLNLDYQGRKVLIPKSVPKIQGNGLEALL